MPMKIPKPFPRRKSSGNALEEAQATEPSFKVFARPHSSGKSMDMALTQHTFPPQRHSYEREDEDLFTVLRPGVSTYVPPVHTPRNRPDHDSGSGGTENSHSTAPYDSAASSARLSTSSTNPSSVDTRSDKNSQSAAQPNQPDAPVPPPHQQRSGGFLRNAGRTFSFGKSKHPEATEQPPVPPVPATKPRFSFSQNRERAMTASSVSTATPPRLLESDLPLDNSGLDGFGNMFDGIGAKSREPSPIRMVPTENPVAPTGNQLRPNAAYANRAAPPRPILVNTNEQIESSPYSWTSENSRDGLMNTPSPANTVVQNSPQTIANRHMAATTRVAVPPPLPADPVDDDDNLFSTTPSRARAYSRSARPAAPPSAFPSSSRYYASPHPTTTIAETPVQSSPVVDRDDSMFDPALLASAELATKYQEARAAPQAMASNKVMTPAQFERYRQQQDERHRMNKVFQNHKPESDESSDDNYEDDEEDDTERDRQASKQRRKQEAHLAVYRQTMMKITGEAPAPAPPPPRSSSMVGVQPVASQSTPELSSHLGSLSFDKSFDKSPARSSDEDEDDDVPLGILAAHGFPNKNRPPNRLASTSSNPNLRSVSQQQGGAASVAGESTKRGPSGGLPVFARHLPEDPYYGASLINQSNREPPAIHANNNLVVPSGAATAHPHHPAGLVGVIAGEERARAMRRGSPNAATGTFELPPSMPSHPGMPRSQTTGSLPNFGMPGMPGMPGMSPMGMPGMPVMPGMPGMPPMLSPGDHAQLQMSQQMTQMMQMQMQWMQQMSQFMTNQGPNPGAQPMNQMPPPAQMSAANMHRPQSMPLQSHMGHEQRSMSTLNPSMANWNSGLPSFHGGPGSTYTPSIAPSERSNIGLASRYRPVSTAPEPEQPWTKRASTMTSTTFRPWSQASTNTKPPPLPTIKKVAPPADEDDDEQGWADMKAKKDQKKKTWKLRKGQNVLQELYNGS